MKHFRRVFGILSAVVMLCSVSISALALNAGDIDMSRTGSILIEMWDTADSKVTSGTLTLYQVAVYERQSDGDLKYAVTDSFAGCDVDSYTDSGASEELAEWTETHSVAGQSQSVSYAGTVMYTDLQLGVYLVVQTGESDGYMPINPFLVTVPIEQNGAVVYDVNATPKTSPATEKPVESPVVTDEPVVSNEPVVSGEPIITGEPVINSDNNKNNESENSSEPVVNMNSGINSNTNNDNSGNNTSDTNGAKTGDNASVWLTVSTVIIVVSFSIITITVYKKGDGRNA